MSKGLNWIKLVCAVAALSVFASNASAAKVALRAVKKNGVGITPTSTVTNAAVSDEYECEIRIFDWNGLRCAGGSNVGNACTNDSNCPGSTCVNLNALGGARGYQGSPDLQAGATSGPNPAGLVLPKGWNAPFPPVSCNTNGLPDESLCDFAPELTCSPATLTCVGTGHNPALGATMATGRTDFIHSTLTFPNGITADVGRVGLNFQFFSLVNESIGRIDAGVEYYGGTIILVVGQFSCGTYTFNFRPDSTFLSDPQGTTTVYPQLIPLTITLPACQPVKQTSDPPDCIVDARRPHSPSATSPAEGIQSVVFTYNQPPTGFQPQNFTRTAIPFGATPPTISTVVASGNNLTLNLSGPINPNQWTCIKHTVTNLENCFGYLPGDVDQSLLVNSDDVVALRNLINTGVGSPLQCDQDRSTRCAPLDLLTEVDLLNGAASFAVWNNQIINTPLGCPSQN